MQNPELPASPLVQRLGFPSNSAGLNADEILRDIPGEAEFLEMEPYQRREIAALLVNRLLDAFENRGRSLDSWESELLVGAVSALATHAWTTTVHYSRMVVEKNGRHRHSLKRDMPVLSLRELREALRLASPD